MKKERRQIDEFDLLEMIEKNPDLIDGIANIAYRKKESRLVINLPNYLKKALKEVAEQKGLSMNEIVREALMYYLTSIRK